MTKTRLEKLETELYGLKMQLERQREFELAKEYTSRTSRTAKELYAEYVQKVNNILKGSSYKLEFTGDRMAVLQANGSVFTFPAKLNKFKMFADVVALLLTGNINRNVTYLDEEGKYTNIDFYISHGGIDFGLDLTYWEDEDGAVVFDYSLVVTEFTKTTNNIRLNAKNLYFHKNGVGFDVVIGEVVHVLETLHELEV